MPEYRYTSIVYCRDCEHKLWREEQYKGFMDRPDVDNFDNCPECDSDDIALKNVNDKTTKTENLSPKERFAQAEEMNRRRDEMW